MRFIFLGLCMSCNVCSSFHSTPQPYPAPFIWLSLQHLIFSSLSLHSACLRQPLEEIHTMTQSASGFCVLQGKASVSIPLVPVFRSRLAYDKCGCNHHQFLVSSKEIVTETSAPSIGIRQKKLMHVLVFASPVFRVLGTFHLLIKSLTLKDT